MKTRQAVCAYYHMFFHIIINLLNLCNYITYGVSIYLNYYHTYVHTYQKILCVQVCTKYNL